MSSNIVIKVYNKENKLKLITKETDSIKIVSLYKYDGENEDIHSFTYLKPPKKMKRFTQVDGVYVEAELKIDDSEQAKQDRTTYYDLWRSVNGIMVERVWITNKRMEQWELAGDMEELKTIEIFETGTVYEERKKGINGEIYITEFKNGEFSDFKFKIPEIKINEYLEKLHYGK